MTPAPPFRGVGVALVTLLDGAGELDVAATAAHAARLVDLGVQAVLVAGTTGEGFLLSLDERDALLAAVLAAAGATPVLMGTGAPTLELAVTRTAAAVAGGAGAVLPLSPPPPVDIVAYYAAVADTAGTVPVLGYHYPAVSPPGIPLDVLPALPVVGCKDSSGDPERLAATAASWPGALYTGSSSLLNLACSLGSAGAILAAANSHPEACRAALAGDEAAQASLRALAEPGIDGIILAKRLTAERFGTSARVRG